MNKVLHLFLGSPDFTGGQRKGGTHGLFRESEKSTILVLSTKSHENWGSGLRSGHLGVNNNLTGRKRDKVTNERRDHMYKGQRVKPYSRILFSHKKE